MLIEISPAELEVMRQALRAAIDLGNDFFTFSPDTVPEGGYGDEILERTYYGYGDLKKDSEKREKAKVLLKRLSI